MSGYASDLTLKAKLLPRNSQGALALASATEMSLLTESRAQKPLPPGNVRLNGFAYVSWPATTSGDVTLSWSHRNRQAQGIGQPLVAQDTSGSYAIEGTLTVRAYVGGALKRTWSGLAGTSQVYSISDRTADDADLAKPVHFTITPVNGTLQGAVRQTPPFVMGA